MTGTLVMCTNFRKVTLLNFSLSQLCLSPKSLFLFLFLLRSKSKLKLTTLNGRNHQYWHQPTFFFSFFLKIRNFINGETKITMILHNSWHLIITHHQVHVPNPIQILVKDPKHTHIKEIMKYKTSELTPAYFSQQGFQVFPR